MIDKEMVNLITHHEGFIPYAYRDSLGYWTIGIGRLIDKRKGGGITPAEADFLLKNDLREVEAGLNENIPWWNSMSVVRQRALVSMAFNLGVHGLLQFRNMLSAMRGHDWHLAAHEALDSRWAKQVGRRAKEIANMIEHDEMPK